MWAWMVTSGFNWMIVGLFLSYHYEGDGCNWLFVKPRPLPDDSLIGTGSMMKQVSVEWNGVQLAIGYSYRYYAVTMYPNLDAKQNGIDGGFLAGPFYLNYSKVKPP